MNKKKVFLLDYDNTLVDFNKALVEAFNEHYGVNVSDQELIHYDFDKNKLSCEGLSGEDLLEFFLDNEKNIYQNVRAYPDSLPFLIELIKDKEAEIHLITARDAQFAKETEECMRKNKLFPFFDKIIHNKNKAELIHLKYKDKYEEIYFIDDKAQEVEKSFFMNPGVKHYLRDNVYNRESSNTKRLYRLTDLFDEKKEVA